MAGSIEKRGKGYRLKVFLGHDENGKAIRPTKQVNNVTEKQAKKELALFIAELENKGYVRPEQITFRELVYGDWLKKEAEPNLTINTRRNYLEKLENRVLPIIGKKQIKSINKVSIYYILDNIKRMDNKDDEPSKSTKKNTLAAMKSVFRFAVQRGMIKENPCDGVEVGRDNRKEKKSYDPYDTKEVALLFEKLALEPLDFQLSTSVAFFSGARVGEVAALEIDRCDFENNTITFNQTIVDKKKEGAVLQLYTKGKDERVIAMPSDIMAALKNYVRKRSADRNEMGINEFRMDHKFIFCHLDGKPYRVDSFYQRWVRFLKRHGLRFVRYHDIRHSSATWLIKEGVNPKTIQERLGHKEMSTTMNIYAHVLKEVDQEASTKFDSLAKNIAKK